MGIILLNIYLFFQQALEKEGVSILGNLAELSPIIALLILVIIGMVFILIYLFKENKNLHSNIQKESQLSFEKLLSTSKAEFDKIISSADVSIQNTLSQKVDSLNEQINNLNIELKIINTDYKDLYKEQSKKYEQAITFMAEKFEKLYEDIARNENQKSQQQYEADKKLIGAINEMITFLQNKEALSNLNSGRFEEMLNEMLDLTKRVLIYAEIKKDK